MGLVNQFCLLFSSKRQFAKQGVALPASPVANAHAYTDWGLLEKYLQGHKIKTWRLPLGLFSIISACLGALLMMGLLQYSGDRPINLLYLLVVFGPLQWLLMAFSVCMASINKPQHAYYSFLPRFKPWLCLPGKLLAWAVSWLNQWLSLAFIVGGLLCLGLMLLTQDLAFAWASTLSQDSAGLSKLLQTIASPWATWWPAAVPNVELVEQTQFYRLQGLNAQYDASTFGRWWPFLLAFITCYALVPRLLLALVLRAVLKHHLRNTLQDDAQLQQLMIEMRMPQVDTASTQQDQHLQAKACSDSLALYTLDLALCYMVWGLGEHDFSRINMAPNIIKLSSQPTLSSQGDTFLIVPGWESPLAALSDDLQMYSQASVKLLLLPLPEGLNTADRQSWQLFAERCAAISSVSVVAMGDH